jgi:lysyl-tRNA synthetase, class II
VPKLSRSFSSTAVARASYDTEEQTLEITFTSGRSYTYENVPEGVWEGLCTTRSVGSYYATHIKGRY